MPKVRMTYSVTKVMDVPDRHNTQSLVNNGIAELEDLLEDSGYRVMLEDCEELDPDEYEDEDD